VYEKEFIKRPRLYLIACSNLGAVVWHYKLQPRLIIFDVVCLPFGFVN